MSLKAQGKRPEIVDLTASKRLSVLQPNMGPRKLVIKNLRTSQDTRAVDDYYARTWSELDAALTSIFAQKEPREPYERLYRGVENICRKGEAARLSDMLTSRFEKHLAGEVLESMKREDSWAAEDDVATLATVLRHWKIWSTQLRSIRSAFSYLDRSYLLTIRAKESEQINDMGIRKFKQAVFGTRRTPEEDSLGAKIIASMCQLVEYDRRGDGRFDAALLKETIAMLHVLNVYGRSFEPRFLAESHSFLEDFAKERSENYSLKDYITSCQQLLGREKLRSDTYNFDSTTKRQLLGDAHAVLIDGYSSKLLNGGSIAKLLDDNDVASMKSLYELLRLSSLQKRLKEPWVEYIQETGKAIVGDAARSAEMVMRLLLLRRSLDVMIRDAFDGDEDFTYGLRESFRIFINNRASASAWNTGTSKVGEMIAKHIDSLLRTGLKGLPPALLSDHKDRAAAELSGVASTGDEDAELDRQLDNVIELFRFIDGKDVFEAFYKKDLARRLLLGKSADNAVEQSMLSKLKSECGSSFTHNLEQMFKDQETSKQVLTAFQTSRQEAGRGRVATELHVNILSEAAWPSYPDMQVLLPKEVLNRIVEFENYYKGRYSGRKLTWKPYLSHCVIKARFNRGPKELQVSGLQGVVLMLFTDAEEQGKEVLSYEDVSQASGLKGGDLKRTLQSLACGRARVLTKHPKGREVTETDTFSVNKAFTDPKFKVKINQVQLSETKEENKATHERVVADRQFETQAAIVRIMKSRKSMTHALLVAEVINQTKSRGAMDPQQIKQNIEK